MTEYYEGDNSCVRCLRSSPIASLIGFIIVLVGGGIFGGATIFARRYLITLLNAPNLFPYLDYAVYGLVGVVGLFSLLAYLICALSSGWNAKHCFESSRKACCGRCCNITLIIVLVFVVLLWTAIACLISYPVISIALLLYRNEGPTRLRLASIERYASGLTDTFNYGPVKFITPTTNYASHIDNARVKRQAIQSSSVQTNPDEWSQSVSSSNEAFVKKIDETVNTNDYVKQGVDTIKPIVEDVKEAISDTGQDLIGNIPKVNSLENLSLEKAGTILTKASDKALSVANSLKLFYKCSQDTLDLSYYGLYDASGLPIVIARANFTERIRVILICAGLAVSGIFLLLLGYIQIIIFSAINYTRLQEARYYETSDAGEEGVALQQ